MPCCVCAAECDAIFCSSCYIVLGKMKEEAVAKLPPDSTMEDEIGACMGAEIALVLNPKLLEYYRNETNKSG